MFWESRPRRRPGRSRGDARRAVVNDYSDRMRTTEHELDRAVDRYVRQRLRELDQLMRENEEANREAERKQDKVHAVEQQVEEARTLVGDVKAALDDLQPRPSPTAVLRRSAADLPAGG